MKQGSTSQQTLSSSIQQIMNVFLFLAIRKQACIRPNPDAHLFVASTWLNTSGLMPHANVLTPLTVKFNAYQENQIGIKERLSVRYQLNLIFYLRLTRLGNIQLQISSKMFKYWLLTGNVLMLEWLWCPHGKGHVLIHVCWLAQIFSTLMLTDLNECVKLIDMEKCSLFHFSEHCPS